MKIVEWQLQNDASSKSPKLTDWNKRSISKKIIDITEFVTWGLSDSYELMH